MDHWVEIEIAIETFWSCNISTTTPSKHIANNELLQLVFYVFWAWHSLNTREGHIYVPFSWQLCT